jgi:hypothetical protein
MAKDPLTTAALHRTLRPNLAESATAAAAVLLDGSTAINSPTLCHDLGALATDHVVTVTADS